jgi:transcription termination factor Rho
VIVSSRASISVPRPLGAGRMTIKANALRTGDAVKGRVRFTRRGVSS